MKSKFLLLTLSAFTFAAFAADPATMPASTPSSTTMPTATNPPANPPTTAPTTYTNPNMKMQNMPNMKTSNMNQQDGQIVQTLMVIDMNEVNAAKEALKKSTDASVKKFAKTMDSSHSADMQQTKKLGITPVSSDKSMALQKKGQVGMTQLMGATGKTFDTMYADMMVNGHQEALLLVDSDLMRNTTNPKLVAHLKAFRATVVHHLQLAKDLQKKLSMTKQS